ncbi:hypothetical protein Tco_0749007 [Tanacetum coccineum]|uniref:Uncharacterized protein n=1 Tax=Tanacetum coccineum TaxID=301880 RepID=A0ABQ4YYG4_9ASTR
MEKGWSWAWSKSKGQEMTSKFGIDCLVVPLKKDGDEVVHKELGDRMERAATTASSLEAEQDSGSGPSHIKYALTKYPTIYTSLIQQFWETASTRTSENEEIETTATIDGRVKTNTEASIRRHLKLEDADGISSLPNTEIFEQLSLMGYASDFDKLTFQKGHFSPQWRFLIHMILHCLSPKKTAWEQNGKKFRHNIRRVSKGYTRVDIPLFPTMLTAPESSPSRITSSPSLSPQTHPSTSQQPPTPPFMQTIHDVEEPTTMPHDSSQPRVQSLGSDEGSLTLNELTVLCITLSKKVENLQNDLKKTKFTYGAAYIKLILRVKKLEHKVKASKSRRRARVIIADNEEDLEDSYKHGRIINEIDQNPSISLVQDEGTSWIQEDAEIQTRTSVDTEILLDQEEPTELKKQRSKLDNKDLRHEESIDCKNRLMKKKDKGIARDAEIPKQLPTRKNLYSKARTRNKRNEGVAETTQAHDIDWSDPAVIRYHAQQNRSFSKAEVRKNMYMYLKNRGGYKQSYFRGMSYEDIRPIFERVWDQNQSFVPKDSKIEKEVMKRSGFDFQKPPAKRQKVGEISGSIRVGNHTEVYQVFEDMLKRFDRDDLEKLWDLVRKKFSSTEPTVDKEKGEKEISTANISVSTAGVSTTKAVLSTITPEVSTAAENLVYIRRSAEKIKNKGKAIMKEVESVQKKTKKQLEQERLSREAAIRLQEHSDLEKALELQKQLDEREEVVGEADLAQVIDLSYPAMLKFYVQQNRSFSKDEVMKNMCMYLKNHGGYKQSHFKGMSYEDIRPIFERVWDQINLLYLRILRLKRK